MSVVADHVILAEVAAGLDGDEGDGQAAGVFQAVRLAKGDVNRLAFAHQPGAVAKRHFGSAFNDDPVFGPVQVGLKAGRFPRSEPQRPDPKAAALGKKRRRGRNGRDRSESHRRLGKACVV